MGRSSVSGTLGSLPRNEPPDLLSRFTVTPEDRSTELTSNIYMLFNFNLISVQCWTLCFAWHYQSRDAQRKTTTLPTAQFAQKIVDLHVPIEGNYYVDFNVSEF